MLPPNSGFSSYPDRLPERAERGSVAPECPGLARVKRECETAWQSAQAASQSAKWAFPRGIGRDNLPRQFHSGKAGMIALSVNGTTYRVDVEDDTPLLWVLRDTIGLTGTKYGCGIAQCGCCTVHIDGVATRSCQVPVGTVGAARVTTIEALAQNAMLHPVQQAWIDHDVPQCGYCQTGMMMAAVALLKEKPDPTDAEIDAAITNICRCGTYQRVRAAIHAAAEILAKRHDRAAAR
jgi:isoquinoline 1-oxidoreductase alpha subunit